MRTLVKRWGVKSVLSVLDQGVFSGSNFVLTLLLARWLAPAEYGAYAVAFSIFLFVAGFHNALILDPLFVLGSSRRGSDVKPYVGALVWLSLGLTAVLSAGLAAAAVVAMLLRSSLAGALFALAIAAPFILLFWLLRAECYLEARPGRALRGSFAYGLVAFAALVVVVRGRHVSSSAAYLCIALASLAAVLCLFPSVGLKREDVAWSTMRRQWGVIAPENWRYGKWVTGSAVVYWLSGTLYLPLLGSFAGLEQAAAFQAMQNLLRPLQQSATALSSLFLPQVSRQRTEHGEHRFRLAVGGIVGLNVAISLAYLALLFVARFWLVSFLYRSSFYAEFVTLLPLLWLATLLGVVTQGLVIGLKSVRRSDLLFWAHALGAAATLSLGLVLVRSLGIQGAAIGSVCSGLLLAAGQLVLLGPYLRRKR
jgi:O-antigen/teichoic acid export membrane protein